MDNDYSASETRRRPPSTGLLIPVVTGSNLAGDTMLREPISAERPSVVEGMIISEKVGCTGPVESIDGRIP